MKSILLSFVTPCGRIGIGGYWWRQLVLALPLYWCCTFSVMAYTSMFRSSRLWLDLSTLPPTALAQGNPLTFLGALRGVGDAAFACSARWHMAMQNDPRFPALTGWQLLPGLPGLLAYLLALLLGWCSFALLLRRLRDAGMSFWLLPCCMPVFWALLVWGLGGPESMFLCAVLLPVIASVALCLMPTQKPAAHPEEETPQPTIQA